MATSRNACSAAQWWGLCHVVRVSDPIERVLKDDCGELCSSPAGLGVSDPIDANLDVLDADFVVREFVGERAILSISTSDTSPPSAVYV